MTIPDDSIIFSAQTFRAIKPNYAKLIYRIKLLIRNYNIDVQEVIEYIISGDCEIEILQQYNQYIIEKNMFTSERIKQMVIDLSSKSGEKTPHNGSATPLNIIYPKKW